MRYREYEAVVQIGYIGRVVRYHSLWRKGSGGNRADMMYAYEKRYGEPWKLETVVHELNLIK